MARDELATSPTGPPEHVGPHTSDIRVAAPFVFEEQVNKSSELTRINPVKEESSRLQGVAWIDSVRRSLQL